MTAHDCLCSCPVCEADHKRHDALMIAVERVIDEFTSARNVGATTASLAELERAYLTYWHPGAAHDPRPSD